MRAVRHATEDEVIAAFLRAEIDSDRHKDRVLRMLRDNGRPRSIVERPDLADPEENAIRRTLLASARSWGRGEGMFQGFPELVDWMLVALTRKELADVRYIAWKWWLEISGGTRLATETARRIRAGELAGGSESALRYHEPIARRLIEGPPLPALIAVRDATRPEFLVLVEGHVRLTAFFLLPELIPHDVEIYLGTADGLHSWGLYE